ncbi:MAG: FUSC family protein [Chitinophagaceae bacterium]
MRTIRFRRNIVRTRQTVRDVAVLQEGPWRWALGVQTGIAIGIAMGWFTIAGYPSYGLIASLGGFTVMYAVSHTLRQRLHALPIVGAGMILASVLGVLCAHNDWLTAACLVVVTVVTSLLAFGTGLGPPGPVLFVLTAAVSAQLAAPLRVSGASMNPFLIPLLVAAGAVLAYAVVLVLTALPFWKSDPPAPGAEEPVLSRRIRLDREMTMVTVRLIIGVIIAILVSRQLGIHRSYWVIVATAAVLQAGPTRRLTTIRAIQRVLGTLLGVGLFELIHHFHPAGIWVVLLIALLQFATQVVIARNYVLGLFFITPLALVNSTIGQIDAAITVRERVVDTLIGAGIALVVFWLEEWWMKGKEKALALKKADQTVGE